MVTHIVFFRLKTYSEPTVAALVEKLSSMRNKVPMLAGIEVGADIARSERAFDVCLVTRFNSHQDLEAYRTDTYHQEVLAYVREHCAETAVVDYETG